MKPLQRLPRLPLLMALLAVLGLGVSNPGLADYEAFAAERLVEEVADQLCAEATLPVLARLVLSNCPQLLRQQRVPLAALVRRQTQRTDLGLLSLYRSELGGQRLLGWRVPRARAVVLGVAGQFVVLEASHDGSQAAAPNLAWLRP